VGTGTITIHQARLRFYPYSVVEPVNWVEEKLGGYLYNHTTPDWFTVLYLFCGRACELGGGETAGRLPVHSHHARRGYDSILILW
jgi:hypothetical protein